MGWLIGALRLMPPWEAHVFGYTILPNPFFGGILLPTLVFGLIYAWPSIERRITRTRARHDLLDRPRDVPWRTAVGAAFFLWVAMIFIAGSSDLRSSTSSASTTSLQVYVYRVLVIEATPGRRSW